MLKRGSWVRLLGDFVAFRWCRFSDEKPEAHEERLLAEHQVAGP